MSNSDELRRKRPPDHHESSDEGTGEGIRRWREPAGWSGRDNRPGFYSITGDFIELPESSEAKSREQR